MQWGKAYKGVAFVIGEVRGQAARQGLFEEVELAGAGALEEAGG